MTAVADSLRSLCYDQMAASSAIEGKRARREAVLHLDLESVADNDRRTREKTPYFGCSHPGLLPSPVVSVILTILFSLFTVQLVRVRFW